LIEGEVTDLGYRFEQVSLSMTTKRENDVERKSDPVKNGVDRMMQKRQYLMTRIWISLEKPTPTSISDRKARFVCPLNLQSSN
jgi:hypothetical protein